MVVLGCFRHLHYVEFLAYTKECLYKLLMDFSTYFFVLSDLGCNFLSQYFASFDENPFLLFRLFLFVQAAWWVYFYNFCFLGFKLLGFCVLMSPIWGGF